MSLEHVDPEVREMSLFGRFSANTRLGKAVSSIARRKERLEKEQVDLNEELEEASDILEAVETVFRLQDELMQDLETGATAVQEAVSTFQVKVQGTRDQLTELLTREAKPAETST